MGRAWLNGKKVEDLPDPVLPLVEYGFGQKKDRKKIWKREKKNENVIE